MRNTAARPQRRIGRGMLAVALVLAFAVVVAGRPAMAANGMLDPTFSGDGVAVFTVGSDDYFSVVRQQVDGKLVAVSEAHFANTGQFGVTRLNANGTLDLTFGGGDGKVAVNVSGNGAFARNAAIQPDGKIVIVGDYNAGSSQANAALVRLNADGTLDTTFDADGVALDDPTAKPLHVIDAVALEPGGNIVIAGYSMASGGRATVLVARFTSTGALDATFGTGGVFEWNASTTSRDFVIDLERMADGTLVLAGGSSATATSNYRFLLLRLTVAGTLDTTFSSDGYVTTSAGRGASGYLSSVAAPAPLATTFVVAGSTTWAASEFLTLFRHDTTNGNLTNWMAPNTDRIRRKTNSSSQFQQVSVVVDGSDRAIATALVDPDGEPDLGVYRYNASGTADTCFDLAGMANVDLGPSVADFDLGAFAELQADGAILAFGNSFQSGHYRNVLVRLAGATDAGTCGNTMLGLRAFRRGSTTVLSGCGLSVGNPCNVGYGSSRRLRSLYHVDTDDGEDVKGLLRLNRWNGVKWAPFRVANINHDNFTLRDARAFYRIAIRSLPRGRYRLHVRTRATDDGVRAVSDYLWITIA